MREANKLSAVKVNRLKEPGRYCDVLGLWLQVTEATNGDGCVSNPTAHLNGMAARLSSLAAP
jgi:hypothetical protein